MEKHVTVILDARDEAVISLYSLLQRGFFIESEMGITLQEFLSGECGIDGNYIKDRIKTVFLDGHPVDDFQKAIIKNRQMLSLSGPMPGLVGATMRAGGFYSSFRSGITYREEGNTGIGGLGIVFCKLFNIIMSDLGRDFLKRGILIKGEDFNNFITGQKEEFWEKIEAIAVDGAMVNKKKMKQGLPNIGPPMVLLIAREP